MIGAAQTRKDGGRGLKTGNDFDQPIFPAKRN